MLHTTPTYALRTEAIPLASEPLLCTTGGGNASHIISINYNEPHSLLRALCTSVGSSFFRINTFTNNNQFIH